MASDPQWKGSQEQFGQLTTIDFDHTVRLAGTRAVRRVSNLILVFVYSYRRIGSP